MRPWSLIRRRMVDADVRVAGVEAAVGPEHDQRVPPVLAGQHVGEPLVLTVLLCGTAERAHTPRMRDGGAA